jgi:hypothetical protein
MLAWQEAPVNESAREEGRLCVAPRQVRGDAAPETLPPFHAVSNTTEAVLRSSSPASGRRQSRQWRARMADELAAVAELVPRWKASRNSGIRGRMARNGKLAGGSAVSTRRVHCLLGPAVAGECSQRTPVGPGARQSPNDESEDRDSRPYGSCGPTALRPTSLTKFRPRERCAQHQPNSCCTFCLASSDLPTVAAR